MLRANIQSTITEKYFHIHESTNYAKQIFLYPEISGYADYTGEYFCERTSFLNYELMLVVKGSLELHTERGAYIVQANNACLIESKAPHYYFSHGKDPISILWMHFNGVMMDAYFQYLWERYQTQAFCVPNNYKLEYLELVQKLASNHPGTEMEISARIMWLLSMLQPIEQKPINRIEEVRQYIQKNYIRNISLKEMADIATYSTSHFCYMFKKYTGQAPHQYLIAFRLSVGYHLIFSTEYSIEEIAEKIGFSTASAFISAFAEKYKTTPARLRNNLKI